MHTSQNNFPRIFKRKRQGGELMPKVKIDTSKARAQKRYDYVAGVLSGGFRQNNLSTDDVSRKTGIPARTVSSCF